MSKPIDRRQFVAAAVATFAGASGCLSTSSSSQPNGSGRLTARVSPPTGNIETGLQPLGIRTGRDGRLYVPTTYRRDQPLPLVVLLHGAGSSSAGWFGSYAERAGAARFILLAPDSRDRTWDLVLSGFGADIAFIDAALQTVFSKCAVDSRRMAVAGFSDGASYALALGITNGDLFDHIIAYSPGFLQTATRRGKPPIFISHGTGDSILPIAGAGRPIAAELQRDGYAVSFTEFNGGHEVPSEISASAMTWLTTAYGRT